MKKYQAVIDIETSGFSKTTNAICEIGIIIIDENNNIVEEYDRLVKPYLSTYGRGMDIHKITISRMEKEGIQPIEICEEVHALLKKYDCTSFIGHNIQRFDAPFLNHFFQRFAEKKHVVDFRSVTDTMNVAKQRIVAPSYSLKNLCTRFGIVNKDEHRALGDCHATLELLNAITGKNAGKDVAHS